MHAVCRGLCRCVAASHPFQHRAKQTSLVRQQSLVVQELACLLGAVLVFGCCLNFAKVSFFFLHCVCPSFWATVKVQNADASGERSKHVAFLVGGGIGGLCNILFELKHHRGLFRVVHSLDNSLRSNLVPEVRVLDIKAEASVTCAIRSLIDYMLE